MIKPDWEMEIDTPATIAVIGGGAIGIEAALYARFLGYYVLLIEAAKMAQAWRRGGHLPMMTRFADAITPLGLAALEAHQPDRLLFDHTAQLTGLEFAEKYLVPLARTDLLSDCVRVHSRVMSVSRIGGRRESPGDIQDRADVEYRLAIHSKSRGWYSERADIILDCSGLSEPRWCGPGGGLAMGQLEHLDSIESGMPDFAGKSKALFAGKRILLCGISLDAVRNMLELLALQRVEPETRVVWLVPSEPGCEEPSQWLERLQALGDHASGLVDHPDVRAALSGSVPTIGVMSALGIDRIVSGPQGLNAVVQTDEDNLLDIPCDRIISNCGWQPNWDHTLPLRVGRSTVLDRPVIDRRGLGGKTSESASQSQPANELEGESIDLSGSVLTMEPHYYVLGSKSFGLAQDRFTLAQGHQQIRQAFAWIGGRENLDLYSNIQRQ